MEKRTSIDSDLYHSALGTLTEYLQSGDFLLTQERQAILAAVLCEDRPFLAPQLFEVLKDSDTPVSQATVYNTLNLFCKAGITVRFAFQEGTFFLASEYCRHRLIVVCNECGKLIYLRRVKLYEQLLRTIVPHFSRMQHAMLGFGYCKECRRKLFRANM